MFPLLALALELDETFFDDKVGSQRLFAFASLLRSQIMTRHVTLLLFSGCYIIRP